jgi:hypothetical protein
MQFKNSAHKRRFMSAIKPMLFELDKIVESNRLSYTECCFEKLDGMVVTDEKKPIGHPP